MSGQVFGFCGLFAWSSQFSSAWCCMDTLASGARLAEYLEGSAEQVNSFSLKYFSFNALNSFPSVHCSHFPASLALSQGRLPTVVALATVFS